MQSPIRVVFVGTSGTGKSTISKVMADHLNLPHITEQARVVVSDMGEVLREIRYRDPILFQHKVLDYQINAEEKYRDSGFIADRSVFDPYIYLLRFSNPTPVMISEYRKRVFDYFFKNPYTQIFFLRPGEFDPPDDGVRSTDRLYRYQVDGMFLFLLKSYAIPFDIITGTIEERLEKGLEILEEKTKRLLKLEEDNLFNTK